jgi:NAD(P)-dependent dehydrogenase (short-subunit alcohol dehydrogenase family)
MIKRNIARLNAGDYGPALAMYTADATLAFPGDNTWATMFRPHERSVEPHPTHRGRTEIEAFLKRYTAHGIQMVVEDILVNGPPWNARAAVRCHDWVPGDPRPYENRAVMWVRTRWGRILNISSVSAITGNRGQVNYAAAKGALNSATKALSLEVASRGVTVNAIAPGIIASPMADAVFDPAIIQQMVPVKRAGTPDEVAALAGFLASPDAAYITGQVISINGGMI